MTVEFSNVGPSDNGDHSIFLDRVTLLILPDCGKNAKCFGREADRYVCECDAGFVGSPSTNAPAKCTAISNHVDANDLVPTIEQLLNRVQTLEQENQRLTSRVDALELETVASKNSIDSLADDRLPSLQTAVADLKKALGDPITAMKSALSSATAKAPRFAESAGNPYVDGVFDVCACAPSPLVNHK